jgi:hypothetical protein
MQPLARISSTYNNDAGMRAAIDAAIGKRRQSTRGANLGPFSGYRIGLDIGNGNIGWCVLLENGRVLHFLTAEEIARLNSQLARNERRIQLPDLADFVPLGTHKFEARESGQKGEKSFSKIRAEVRAKSGLLDARQRRRLHVRKALQKARLLPPDNEAEEGHTDIPADKLRVRLLDSNFKGHPHDLGRALRNVLKRRGWLKPIGRAGKDEESGFGDTSTKNYREALRAFECETVGEFLERCAQDAKRDGVRFRKRHRSLAWQEENKKSKPKDVGAAKSYDVFQFLAPTYELIREEARLIRERQQDNVRIDDKEWANIEEKAEFRRKLEAKTPGRCKYFPGEYRCVRAVPGFQRFRFLEQLSHLRDVHGQILGNAAFQKAVELLTQKEKISLAELSRALGTAQLRFDKGDDEGKRTVIGAKTDIALTAALGEAWINLPIKERDNWTMRFLRRHWTTAAGIPTWTSDDDTALVRDVDTTFGSDALRKVDEVAGKALNEEDKFANISPKAAGILAEAYAERLDYEQRIAKLREAGAPEPELALYERLPYYGEVMPDQTVPAVGFAPLDRTCSEEREHGRAANPDVHIVMNAIRRVVNEIIEMMGGILPTTCVIEMARSALSEDDANKYSQRAREREKLRQTIIAEIEKVCGGLGIRIPRGPGLDRLVERWKAGIRQNWRDYDGSRIERSLLLDATEYQLDHVSPAAFGEFRENNLFVSRFNSKKGRRLPWQAFGDDMAFQPALLAFATFGLRQRIDLLKKALASKRPISRQRKVRIEESLRRAQAELDQLGAIGIPRPDVAAALERTLTDRLEDLADSRDGSDDVSRKKGTPRPFDGGDQASLFCRFGPNARPPETEFAARDVPNIGWSTKLALRYLCHLGAEAEAVKPWAVHALRSMFRIDKTGMRGDLRNHAVDAFLVGHFDARILRPAFAAIRGARAYEEIYDLRVLDSAMSHIADGSKFLEQLKCNIDRLEATLPTVATAHRADNRWNPGDTIGSSYGQLGGDNIYTFRPTRAEREAFTKIAAKFGRKPKDGVIMRYDELLALMFAKPMDEIDRKLRDVLRKEAKARYRTRGNGSIKVTEISMQTALPLPEQPGAFIDGESKFAIGGASANSKRYVVSVAEFAKMGSAERRELFSERRPIYRRGDTVVNDEQAFVVTGLLGDGRLITYPIDSAGRAEGKKRISIPHNTKSSVTRFACDVLGRRLHRLRKSPGGLKPVPYPLRGE